MPDIKMGSLFDGSGAFPLAANLNGITPVWASEIEPFPIRVTTKRLPEMKHIGDICRINGGGIQPVDIISFGSPCTDLSLAGKRLGISGSKSSLFFEAIRVIKEMRCKTNGRYPRFIIWENVPGAFSSGKSRDFRTVLEEIAKIKDETLSVPMPPKDKWLTAGEIVGDDFSIAYRTVDAQFWGVPQRRRRIYLVADFGGECAGEILFEPQSVSWHPPQSAVPWETAAAYAEGGAGNAVSFQPGAMSRLGGHHVTEQTCTLRAQMGDNQVCVALFENHSQDTRYTGPLDTARTVSANYGEGGNNQPFVVKEMPAVFRKGTRPHNRNEAQIWEEAETANTLNTFDTGESRCSELTVEKKIYGICSDGSNAMKSPNPHSGIYEAETSRTLDANGGTPACNQGGLAIVESYSLQGTMIGRKDKNGPKGSGIKKDISFTIDTVSNHAVAYAGEQRLGSDGDVTGTIQASCHDKQFLGNQEAFSGDYHVISPGYTVRRLTPTECASLQGFSKNWCSNLGTENPSEDDIAFWAEVFETHRKVMGTSSKPKSRNQIIKWLENPHSDSAEYKLWGNGCALPCVCFVVAGIARVIKGL